MAKRALVLGGGGTLGIAWMTGLAATLADSGIRLTEADLFVGTSAGSVVGTQLAFGVDVQVLKAFQQSEGDKPTGFEKEADPAAIMKVLSTWFSAPEVTPALRREIGAMALAASTMAEERWVSIFHRTLGEVPWPAKPVKLTAVDAESGELTVWENHHGDVPVARAMAASCAVPCLAPTVAIRGRRYMDGGVRSGTNADLASGCEKVLIIAPMGSPGHPLGYRQALAEIDQLRAGGSQVEFVAPDSEALAAFGPNMMDATRRLAALDAGARQGKDLAARLAKFWKA